MTRAHGAFEVKMAPLSGDPSTGGDAIGRMSIDKQFKGDLEGSSKGQMVAHSTAVQGSAGYVAMEVVTAAIAGRKGTFVLQHSGTMSHGTFQLSVTVVPDSGTAELKGLAGSMNIIIDGGKHAYEFDYTL